MLTFPALIDAWKGDRTERQTAESLGVSANTIGNWIDGTCLPPDTRLPDIARVIGIPVAYLREVIEQERRQRPAPARRKPIHA